MLGSGFICCNRCGCIFEATIMPTITIRCPFCGKNFNGKDERDTVGEIVNWGKTEFQKLGNRVTEGTLTAILHFSTIEVSLNLPNETYHKRTYLIRNFSAIHDIREAIHISNYESHYEDKHIIIARFIRNGDEVLVKFILGVLEE